VGGPAEADLLVKLLDQFVEDIGVDARRIYATTVSYGSQLWNAFAKGPDLFAAGLVTGGFAVNAEHAAAIAAAEIPLWVTHGVSPDPPSPRFSSVKATMGRGAQGVLPMNRGRRWLAPPCSPSWLRDSPCRCCCVSPSAPLRSPRRRRVIPAESEAQ
jgi:hypothetical protein